MRGTVYVVGAGPGHPGLLTLSGHRLLRDADLVVYGRLVSQDVLALANPSAEKLPLTASERGEVLRLAASRALRGDTVVLLKDGDPLIYGRLADDCLLLSKLGVECAVVPGVSSVTAAAACAGVPLTVGGSPFVIACGLRPSGLRNLARYAGTVVVLMVRGRLGSVVRELEESGASYRAMVLVEAATRPGWRVRELTRARHDDVSVSDGALPTILIASKASPRLRFVRLAP